LKVSHRQRHVDRGCETLLRKLHEVGDLTKHQIHIHEIPPKNPWGSRPTGNAYGHRTEPPDPTHVPPDQGRTHPAPCARSFINVGTDVTAGGSSDPKRARTCSGPAWAPEEKGTRRLFTGTMACVVNVGIAWSRRPKNRQSLIGRPTRTLRGTLRRLARQEAIERSIEQFGDRWVQRECYNQWCERASSTAGAMGERSSRYGSIVRADDPVQYSFSTS
jgi:hypothetical protein